MGSRRDAVKIYIALLRGINIGGKHILPMKSFVAILEDMGCESVRTYIQSGNAVFRHPKISREGVAEEIRARIRTAHGFEPHVMLVESKALHAAVKNNPFPTENGKALHFFFLAAPPEAPDLDRLETLKSETEAFAINGDMFYLYAPDGIGRSRLAARVEQLLGVPATARNWNTVNRLLAMLHQV